MLAGFVFLSGTVGLISFLQPAGAISGRGEGSVTEGSDPRSADFNGDSFVDLAIGIVGKKVGEATRAGAVMVLYGARGGLSGTGSQLWTQDSPGVEDTSETDDGFGRTLTAGDFDGDGFADLAVGVPFEDVEIPGSPRQNAVGVVTVLYGTRRGLSAEKNQLWSQNSPGVLGGVGMIFETFGQSLAAGDFDGDGFADLAVGVDGEDVGTARDAGGVNVIYGTAAGLSAAGNQFWHQDKAIGVREEAEDQDGYGFSLTAGDFNGDGFTDLAVGVVGEDIGTARDAGAVNILYGGPHGLSASGDQLWSQESSLGVRGKADGLDFFGFALAAGDFDGDRFADLAVGVPFEDAGPVVDGGAANVLYGTRAGLSAAGDQLWSQGVDLRGREETFDNFAEALAAGDFNGDGFADLALGVPGEDLVRVFNAGAVNVVYGGPGGLSAAGDQLWSQDSPGVLDFAEHGDTFGFALAAGDFNGDGFADLAVGAPLDGVGSARQAGALNVLYGTAAGLSMDADQLWTQESPGVQGTAQEDDLFGFALAAQ